MCSSHCTASYNTWNSCSSETAQLSEPCASNLKVTQYFSMAVISGSFCGSLFTCPKFLQWKLVRIWFWSTAWTAEHALLPGICAWATGRITELHCSLSRRMQNGWKLFDSWVVKLSYYYDFFLRLFQGSSTTFLLSRKELVQCSMRSLTSELSLHNPLEARSLSSLWLKMK